jgi:hypothetical protein
MKNYTLPNSYWPILSQSKFMEYKLKSRVHVDNPNQHFVKLSMNTHQFLTSKKGFLTIATAVIFIVIVTMTALIATSETSGATDKVLNTTDVDKPVTPATPSEPENTPEEETPTVPKTKTLKVISSHESHPCGRNGTGMICGSFDVEGIKNTKNGKHYGMRIFYALRNEDKAKTLVQDLQAISKKKFGLQNITTEKWICEKAGFITQVEKQINSRKSIISPSLELALDRIERSGFIPFYNDFVTRSFSAKEWGQTDFFVAFPINKTIKSKYNLFSTTKIDLSQKSDSTAESIISEPFENLKFDDKSSIILFSKAKNTTSVRKIENLFGTKDLSAISIQFIPVSLETNLAEQFDSYVEYAIKWPNSVQTMLGKLNVVINYGWNDIDQIAILDNIKTGGLEEEFMRQGKLDSKFRPFPKFRPFSALLIGAEKDVQDFMTKYLKLTQSE